MSGCLDVWMSGCVHARMYRWCVCACVRMNHAGIHGYMDVCNSDYTIRRAMHDSVRFSTSSATAGSLTDCTTPQPTCGSLIWHAARCDLNIVHDHPRLRTRRTLHKHREAFTQPSRTRNAHTLIADIANCSRSVHKHHEPFTRRSRTRNAHTSIANIENRSQTVHKHHEPFTKRSQTS